MSRFLSGANRAAQYYQGRYPSASTFSRLEKFLIHTTETRGWPGYGGGASAPNATYYPERREIRQHFDNNRSARALRDPSGTAVRENRDNIFQLEIICYSSYSLVERFGGLWVGDLTDTHMRDIAEIINQLHADWDLPIQSSVTWREGRRTFYDNVRLSGPQFDAYRGILGHVHASGNSHWDPGGFRYSQLARHLTEDDDMKADEREALFEIRKNLANSTDGRVKHPHNAGSASVFYGVQETWEDTWALNHRLVSKPWEFSDESKMRWRWFPWAAYGQARRARNEAREANRKMDKVLEQQQAILAAQEGLDTPAVIARIDEHAAENEAALEAHADRLTELADGLEAAADEREELAQLVRQVQTGDLSAEDLVRLMGEKLAATPDA